ncbi:amidoligase family protein [Marinobacter daepoensis]|uniref:Amidoligase family protein n=1 Tax=Marinobacter daepoensis TaxID=262077 RepID=A0ABS3BE50_9GAMM|nr:amidoligase family protein [Marinobacter daepoensis]MBN7769630.1 amidoligase family protein [Marinobacter daepoensis]MBY6078320.1 amidoligase family protein [Marinobacter daepoensis]
MTAYKRCKMPVNQKNQDGQERKVGVEIELSGLSYDDLVTHAAHLLAGTPELASRYVTRLETDAGTYTIELDSDPIKDLDLADERFPESIREIGTHAMDVIDFAAERVVPLEIVSPPLVMSALDDIEHLVDELRALGAEGSREAIYFAFGLQLNPELPDLQAGTLIRYLQAFGLLYDWLKSRHQLDISRKFTTYIEPWSGRYTEKLMADDYNPDLQTLMRDYLQHNPTRNKALDLLPLFAHLDDVLLAEYVNDPRIKSRPTLHYRLPDCDIDNPDWHFSTVWNDWVVLEELANNAPDLSSLRQAFRDAQKFNLHNLTHSWRETTDSWLRQHGYV